MYKEVLKKYHNIFVLQTQKINFNVIQDNIFKEKVAWIVQSRVLSVQIYHNVFSVIQIITLTTKDRVFQLVMFIILIVLHVTRQIQIYVVNAKRDMQ
jgi:hypothetical protein